MPFCPVCRYEYVPGKIRCPDCDVDLVDKLTEKPEPVSEWADLVTVANFPFEAGAQVAKLKLESCGIRAVLSNEYIAQTDISIAFAQGGVHVMVERRDAQRAAEILERDG